MTVVGGAVGDFTAEDDVVVAPARARELVLSMSARCPTERPPAAPAGAVLALDVRTGSSVRPYELSLPKDAGQQIFAMACGWGPLPESVHLVAPGVVDAAGGLRLEIGAATRAPVRLLALRSGADSGVSITVPELAAGPLLLPRWSPIGSPVRTLQAQLGVTECTAARAAARTGGARVTAVVEDVDGERAQVDLPLDPVVLEQWVAEVCT